MNENEPNNNISNEEAKKIGEQHEKVRKTGAVAAAVLSAFLNTAPVAAASYTPPTEPNETPELIVPKTGAEQPVTGDIVLRQGMNPEQIDAVAKKAVSRYEMEQSFKGVLQECINTAKETGNTEQGTQKCADWYKAETAKGYSTQALRVMQQSLAQARATVEKGGSPDYANHYMHQDGQTQEGEKDPNYAGAALAIAMISGLVLGGYMVVNSGNWDGYNDPKNKED